MIDASTKDLKPERYVQFVCFVIDQAKARDRVVQEVRFDAVPGLNTDYDSEVMRQLGGKGIMVTRAAGGFHQGVGAAEQAHGMLENAAEAMTCRAGRGRNYLLLGRSYAVYIYNVQPAYGGEKSRLEVFTEKLGTPGVRPNFAKIPPLLFGVRVAYVADVQERGPKGILDKKSPVAELVGIQGSTYKLRKFNGQTIFRAPEQVLPLNEHEMVGRDYGELHVGREERLDEG